MLASEMLSGPDTGGGFLFQLTVERGGASPGFTFHAQEGREDAGGPPKGSPEPLGFAHPAKQCMYGGPRCWHRQFRLPAASAGLVRLAYNRTRLTFALQIDQTVGRARPDVEEGLRQLSASLGPTLQQEGVPWFIGGSCAAWLAGVAVVPRDIDIGTDSAGARRLAELLEMFLIEPPAPVGSGSESVAWGAKAFLGNLHRGIRAEWKAVGEERAGCDEFSAETMKARVVPRAWEGFPFPTSPLEFVFVRWLARGDTGRLRAVEEYRAHHELNPELLRKAAALCSIPPEGGAQLARWISGSP
ncbi:MAG TPA: hypothetical protein VJS68_03420 [Thermoplasmata archaeon]|nr:hypothetical protein [Thermoplasmata archaeon]